MRKVPFPADYRRLLEKQSRVVRQGARQGSSPPFFSVITISRNRVADLERAIGSLRAQAERDFEHIVVDCASSDGTVELLQKVGVDVWLSEADAGIADALNKGISLASGEWIVLMHADDQLAPGALAQWKRMAAAGGDADILSCAIRYSDGPEIAPDPAGMARRMSMPHPGMAVRRSLHERIGLFRTDFRIALDYEFTLRALQMGAKVRCDPVVVAWKQPGGLSDTQLFRSRNENLRARVRWLGLRPWMLAHYAREVTSLALGRLFKQ